jgi:cell division inhibitor SepF
MKVLDKFLDVMGFSEERDDFIDEVESVDVFQEIKPSRKTRGQVLPFTSRDQNRVVLIEPLSFDDCQQISDHLKSKRIVIINLENIDIMMARRVIDFVGGTTYALGGCMQKVGAGIIIAAPSNVDISGDINNMSQPKEVFAWINKITQSSDN